jgi:hypothetical protein
MIGLYVKQKTALRIGKTFLQFFILIKWEFDIKFKKPLPSG